MRRHRAEACDRLALADVRPLVEPGAAAAALPDGTALALRWGTARGCYGGRPGRVLLLSCPVCSRSARVLWRPPGCGWGCCKCWPLSHASHRRPGAHREPPFQITPPDAARDATAPRPRSLSHEAPAPRGR